MRLVRVVGFALSALCLVLIARRLDPGTLVAALRNAQFIWLLPAMAALGLFLVLNAARWRALLAPAAVLPTTRLLRWQLIGYLANAALPLRAGDIARVFLVGRDRRVGTGAALATIVVEKLCDGAALTALLLVGLLLVAVPAWVTWMSRVGAVVFAGGLVLLLVAASPRIVLPIPATGRWAAIGRLVSSARGVTPGPAALALLLGRSVLLWCAAVLNTACILRAFGAGGSLPDAVLVTSGLNLALTIPAGPAAIGSYELTIAALLGAVGVASGPAQLAALGMRAAQYAPPALAGAVALWSERLSLRDIARSAPAGSSEKSEPADDCTGARTVGSTRGPVEPARLGRADSSPPTAETQGRVGSDTSPRAEPTP